MNGLTDDEVDRFHKLRVARIHEKKRIARQKACVKANSKLLPDFYNDKELAEIEKFTNEHVLRNSTNLVVSCLENGVFEYSDIDNIYAGDSDESENDEKEIFNWYLVSYDLFRRLASKGQPTLGRMGYTWWGRTRAARFPIYMEPVIIQIFKESTNDRVA